MSNLHEALQAAIDRADPEAGTPTISVAVLRSLLAAYPPDITDDVGHGGRKDGEDRLNALAAKVRTEYRPICYWLYKRADNGDLRYKALTPQGEEIVGTEDDLAVFVTALTW